MDTASVLARIEAHVRERELIPAGGEVVCLVSGGADSTCLWHALRALGYAVSALHVDHGLRGAESDEDARFCREEFGADVVDGNGGPGIARDDGAEGPAAATPRPIPARRNCAASATRSRPTVCGPPAIPRRTRSRRSSTAS